MLLALLFGCAEFALLQAAYDDFTNPLVAQAFYVGVDPLPAGLDLGDNPWMLGSTARVLLADASGLSDLAEAPVTDAEVMLGFGDGEIPLIADGEGSWTADGTDGLGWSSGAETVLSIQRESASRIALTTPVSPTFALPEVHAPGTALVLDLEGQEFDNILVTVVRLRDGATVHDSTPLDIMELYQLTHSSSELTATVPASAFTEPGPYAVGVAGLVNADPDDYEGVNLALSALTAGAMVFAPLQVSPSP